MENMPVTRWRQSGELELYQFPSETRNFPGWHLHATLVGYQSLLTLAELLHESSQQARRSVALASVESGAIRNGGSGRLIAAHRWTIKFDPTLFPANHWYWEGTHDHPKLQLGSGKLAHLLRCLELCCQGGNDFCIHSDNAPLHGVVLNKPALWFW